MTSPLKLSEDLNEFLKLLSSHQVEFLVVGAHAVAYHGRARFTQDLDIFLRRSDENGSKLISALEEFGFPIDHSQIRRFVESKRAMIRLGVKPNLIELLNFLDGVEFSEAYERREPVCFGEAKIFMISLHDLMLTKQAVGRPQDLADLDLLRSINRLEKSADQ